MANTRAGNVVKIDTSAALSDIKRVCGIKYVGAASGTALITSGPSGSGSRLWEHDGDVLQYEEVEITDADGIYVAVTNGAVVYLYV